MSIPVFKLPDPPANRIWCAICFGLCKDWFEKLMKAELDVIVGDGERGYTDISVPKDQLAGMPPLRIAVTRFFYGPMRQFGFMEVCWDHGMSLQINETGVMGAPAGSEAAVAQLMQQMGGVPVPGAPAQPAINGPRPARQRPSHFPG